MSTIEYRKLCIPLQVAAERIEKLGRKAERVRNYEQADIEGRSSSFLSFGI